MPRVTMSGAYAATTVGEVFVVVGTRTVSDTRWIEPCQILRELEVRRAAAERRPRVANLR